jgi:hypothetical protein
VLEKKIPNVVKLAPELHRPQVFLRLIDELYDDQNTFDVTHWPRSIEQGREFYSFCVKSCSFDGLHMQEFSVKNGRDKQLIYILMLLS